MVVAIASSVSVVNPVDDQLPLIARIGQSYSWSFSPNTFVSSNGALTYSAPTLPGWLAFDASTQTLYGTPTDSDEGNPEITVTAQDSSSSASCTFTLCVTPFPAPELKIPIAGQFYPNNPSLSSVFMIEQTSALATPNPALRVPPRWSFSIGFDGDTFTSDNNIYYEVLQADGSDSSGRCHCLSGDFVFCPARFRSTGLLGFNTSIRPRRCVARTLHFTKLAPHDQY
jgi:axial budding pattern protein 2